MGRAGFHTLEKGTFNSDLKQRVPVPSGGLEIPVPEISSLKHL